MFIKDNQAIIRKTFIICIFFACVFSSIIALAEDDFKPLFKPSLTITKATGPITIDGYLDDPGWKDAARIDNFVERFPGDNTKPEVTTTMMITYDENNLYVAFNCLDDPKKLRATLCQRDQYSGDDWVGLLIDTYGEGSWAYEFRANPYGIQNDVLWTKIGGENEGFDLVWESIGKITATGYQVEFAIPFSSMRFPNKEIQTWRMDFWRTRPRESYIQYSWAANDRNEQCWPCQWGTVAGIRGVRPGQGIEILPSLVGSQSGSLISDTTGLHFKNNKSKTDLSIGAKYSISSDVTAEASYNPDFSQVESDAAQIDVNTTFALMYPEKRPFFQEGADLFRTLFNSFYTRTINDPRYAAKLTARRDGMNLAFLSAYDEKTPYIIPREESSILFNSGKSLVNVLRGLKTYGNNSQIGFILNDRRFEQDGSNTVFALDHDIRLTNNYSIDGQYIVTHTREGKTSSRNPDFEGIIFGNGKHSAIFNGESFWGSASVTELKRNSRHSSFRVGYTQVSPAYRTETGYDPLINYRDLYSYYGYAIYPKAGLFTQFTPELNGEMRWTYNGDKTREYGVVGFESNLRLLQTYWSVNYKYGSEVWNRIKFDHLWTVENRLNSSISNQIGYYFNIDYGDDFARYQLVKMRYLSINAGLTLKPINSLVIEPDYSYYGGRELVTRARLFDGYIVRVRTQFQIARELSLRLVVQYNKFSKDWQVDPLITYRLSSFSLFYIGSSHNYIDMPNSINNQNEWKLNQRQFFLKLQYLFQI